LKYDIEMTESLNIKSQDNSAKKNKTTENTMHTANTMISENSLEFSNNKANLSKY